MKVLHVINSLMAGGAEKLVVDFIIQCRENNKIDIDILLLDDSRTPFYSELEKYGNISTIKKNNILGIYNPINILRIKKVIVSYDVVHVHLFPSLYWVAAARLLGAKNCKILYTEHNTHNKRRDIFLFNYIDRFFYRQYDEIVAVSQMTFNNLDTYLNHTCKNLQQISNGINLSTIKSAKPYSKASLNIDENIKLLIQVSSFTPQKDQKTVIKALNHLTPSVHLFLVGDGPCKKECESYAKSTKVANRVHFLGIRGDVPRLLKTADIVILSSHFEGLSLASIEGMASGKPFIVSQVPGLEEVVEGAGLLFPKGDDEKLAKLINKLLEDKQYANNIVSKCLEKSKGYNINVMLDKYLALYHSL